MSKKQERVRERATGGGSFVRQKDGSLKRVAGTETADWKSPAGGQVETTAASAAGPASDPAAMAGSSTN